MNDEFEGVYGVAERTEKSRGGSVRIAVVQPRFEPSASE
jgi:hypothetical protein